MPLKLILGRAGSGKTTACIEEIRTRLRQDTQKQYLMITPEQATFAAEERILSALGSAGGLAFRVLSFRRFVHFVLQERGGGPFTGFGYRRQKPDFAGDFGRA